jgi:Ca-activated chloride channel family protein
MVRFQTVRVSMAASLALCILLLLCGRNSRGSQAGASQNSTDTVLVRVSVTDPLNRYVADLDQKDFKVHEDRAAQIITYFAHKPAPISMGIIYEDAGKIESIRNAIAHILQSGNQQDDFFLISFSAKKAAQVEDFNKQGSIIQDSTSFGKVAGLSALDDALYVGLDRIKKRTNVKKALVVISEARHNLAGYAYRIGKNPDFQVYAIGRTAMLLAGPESIVAVTAGNAYQLDNLNDLDYYISLIRAELQNQYVLGYSPSNRKRDGKFRKISVEVNPPAGLPKLTVKAQKGYYAPEP